MLPLLGGAAALFAYTGLPGAVTRRPLGSTEHMGPPQRDDERWPFRGEGVDNLTELTQTPIRVTENSPASQRVFELPFSECDVIVIGGAAGGLASAAALLRRGVKSVLVVEKNENVGDIWRSRYHRLHLHDIAEECSLPGFALPADYAKFCTREEYATYLEAYALCKRIQVHYLTLAKHVHQTPLGWEVTLQDLSPTGVGATQMIKCRHVVLANGVYNDPFVPAIPQGGAYTGMQVHSCRYTNGTELALRDKRVLVVGFGNSAAEIAIDLVEHGANKPMVLIRSEVTILPRWAVQRSQEVLHSHALPLLSLPFGWLVVGLGAALLVDPLAYAVQRMEYGGREGLRALGLPLSWKLPVARALLDKEPPVMDVGTIECAKRGLLELKQGEIEEANGKSLRFKGETEFHEFDCIIWATGYRMFEGHRHLFDEKMYARVGSGVDGLLAHGITPGSEHPQVKGLWLNFGRLQMLNLGARRLAWGIAKDMKVDGGENDLVDASESWPVTIGKHVLAAGAGYYCWKQYGQPKLKSKI